MPTHKPKALRKICALLVALFAAVLCCGNDLSQAIGVSLSMVIFWGLVAGSVGCCLPGDRKRYAKNGFDFGVSIAAILIFGVPLLNLLLGGQLLGPSPSQASPTSNHADNGALRTELRAFMAEATRLGNEYDGQVSAVFGDGTFQPERLDTAENVDAALSKVARLQDLTNNLQKQTDGLLQSLPDRIQRLPVDAAFKRQFLNDYQVSLTTTLLGVRSYFANEHELLAALSRELFFLKSRLGHFQLKDGTILFDNSADVETYNANVQSLQQLAKKEQQLRNELVSPAALKKVEEFLKD